MVPGDRALAARGDKRLRYRLVARSAVFDDLSRNELIIDLAHGHRMVCGQDLGGYLDQLRGLAMPAHCEPVASDGRLVLLPVPFPIVF
jgi:hypothetical protein